MLKGEVRGHKVMEEMPHSINLQSEVVSAKFQVLENQLWNLEKV